MGRLGRGGLDGGRRMRLGTQKELAKDLSRNNNELEGEPIAYGTLEDKRRTYVKECGEMCFAEYIWKAK